jgi:hypothetical protein
MITEYKAATIHDISVYFIKGNKKPLIAGGYFKQKARSKK